MKPRRSLVLLATILASGVVFLDGSVVNLALPKIAASLHASFADLQWIADGYLMTLSAFILLGGSLGDVIGRRRIFLVGAAGFGITSVLCGLAPDVLWLVALRALQGIFGAMLVPQSLAIIDTHFPAAERGKAMGTWAAWAGAFTAIAPLVGGYFLDVSSWQWIFFINAPLLLVCIWLGAASIEHDQKTHARRLDIGGALLAVLALMGLTYGLIEGSASHWAAHALLALAAGVILSGLFLWYESRQPDPMVQLSLFRSRNFAGANAMTFAMYGALGGVILILVIYLQETMHYTSIQAGLSTLPITVLLLLFSRRVGGLATRFGPRIFMTVGPLLAAAGMFSWLGLRPGMPYITAVLPGVLLFSVGMTLLVAPLTTAVMSSVSENNAGIASGINNAVSRLGGLIVVALLGLFGAAYAYQFGLVLCGSLAVAAGAISYFAIRNEQLRS